MSFTITQRPDFALVTVNLKAGETYHSGQGAMATMSPNIELKASLKGGLMGSISRGLGGESLIISSYTAQGGDGEITFAAGRLEMPFIMLSMDRPIFICNVVHTSQTQKG